MILRKKESTFTFLFRFLRPYKWLLVLLVCNAICWAFLRLCGNWAIKMLIDAAGEGKSLRSGLYLMVFIPFGWTLSYRLQDIVVRTLMPNLRRDVAQATTHHLLTRSSLFHKKSTVGSLTKYTDNLMTRIPMFLTQIIGTLSQTTTLIIMLGSIVCADWSVGSLWLGWTLFFLLTGYIMYPYIQAINKRVVTALNDIISHLTDVLTNIIVVKLFGRAAHEDKLMGKKLCASRTAERKRYTFYFFFYAFHGIIFIMVCALSAWQIVQLYEEKKITLGDLPFLFRSCSIIATTIFPILAVIRKVITHWGHIEQAHRFIFLQESSKESDNAITLKNPEGKIHFKGVSLFHQEGSSLFERVTITIPRGQRVLLVGDSGSGKTSFVKMLLRFYDPDEGVISIDGQDISRFSSQSLCKHISMVTQEPYLFHRSIRDNIHYGNLEATSGEVYEAARKAHLHDFIFSLPQGYDTLISEGGSSLSGGQKQRIAIARAMVKKAPICIFDEATSNLDPVTTFHVQESLKALYKSHQPTQLIITHQPHTAPKVDRILVFDQGKGIIEEGTHSELMRKKGRYYDFWQQDTFNRGH